jgi:FtsP/CotA-like multicopper oxidase with cupredoxin domain/peroxiredoxin
MRSFQKFVTLNVFLIWFGFAAVAQAQEVDIDDRAAAEGAYKKLQQRWAEYRRTPSEPGRWKSIQGRSLDFLAEPTEESKREALLPQPQWQSLVRNSKAEFVEPESFRSKNGVLRVALEARYGDHTIGKDPVHLRGFNGKLVGPTLRAKPGDKLYVTFKNTLPGERWLPHMMNSLNSFNTMNMHYHGLHVSPNGISDNVLIQVGPSETQEYIVDIPKNHTTGTYWYHPHRHGSTAGDVASGMSGALIIESKEDEPGLDNIPEIKAAKERVMVLNQIPYIYKNTFGEPPNQVTFDLKAGVVEAKYVNFMFGPGDWATLGRYTTINGVQLPVIRMKPGQIERWRIVDSGQREMIMLKIISNPAVPGQKSAQINFHEIAVDGLALGTIIESESLELWPGYRSDVLVKAPSTQGEYFLIDDIAPAATTMSGQDKELNYVARIVVEGPPVNMKLPDAVSLQNLRLPSIQDKELTGKQEAKYGILKAGDSLAFTIDGKSFDMETARTLNLNDVDEWTLRSINDVGLVTHPFHIHVNPFEVTSIMAPIVADDGTVIMENGSPKLAEQLKNGPVWRDTVKIPGGGLVTMRTRYSDFVGTFVQHCHILDHEDQGMMELIDIVDPKSVPTSKVASKSKPGSIAPDFTLMDGNGMSHSLAEFDGKPTALFFFKGHGCLHCAQQVAVFTEHYPAFLLSGVQVIGVTSDNVETLKSAIESTPCPFLLLADPEGSAFAKFDCVAADGLQHGTFALNGNRHINWRTIGASPFLAVEDLLSLSVLSDSKQSSTGPTSPPPVRTGRSVR